MSVFIATGRMWIRCFHHNVQLGEEDPAQAPPRAGLNVWLTGYGTVAGQL